MLFEAYCDCFTTKFTLFLFEATTALSEVFEKFMVWLLEWTLHIFQVFLLRCKAMIKIG